MAMRGHCASPELYRRAILHRGDAHKSSLMVCTNRKEEIYHRSCFYEGNLHLHDAQDGVLRVGTTCMRDWLNSVLEYASLSLMLFLGLS